MIVGAGRAGKTALTRSITGEPFLSQLESTIGINELRCDVQNVRLSSANDQGAGNNWAKYEEKSNFLDSAIAKGLKLKPTASDNTTPSITNVALNEPQKKNDRVLSAPLAVASQQNGRTTMNEERVDNYDEADKEKRISVESINEEEIMKCLADDIQLLNSKYILSIYDYGGQNVFNVIHPFFLTSYGVYLVVFNMPQLASSSTQREQEECLEYLRFWVNSIAIHSFDAKRQEIAPIFFIGTRKDIISLPKEHEIIAKLLTSSFQNHKIWPFVIPNHHGIGNKGNTTFPFFPVDNTLGIQDIVIQQLLTKMEKTIEVSYYSNLEIPLIWLKAIDKMKEKASSGSSSSTGWYSQCFFLLLFFCLDRLVNNE
jgi:GTPase SAR1 family protein